MGFARRLPTLELGSALVAASVLASLAACTAGPGDPIVGGGAGLAMGSAAGIRVDAGAAAESGVRFAGEIYPIVKERCALAGCHVTSVTTNHWTDFSTAASTYQRWVNGPAFDFCVDPPEPRPLVRTLVVPRDLEQSFLITKLTSRREQLCDSRHQPRMPPPPMPPLTAIQIDTIATWIRQGAQDN